MKALKLKPIGPTEEAIETKVYAAEKNAASIRMAIITLNIFVYFFVMDRTGTIPWLANSTVVVASVYGLYVLLFQPYRRFPVLLSSYFTSLSDAVLITLWLLATGGIKSPFYVLWYASIVAVASRYRYRETLLAAALYAASYLGLVASLNQFTDHLTEVIVRISYIFFVGLLGGLLARETLAQTKVKIELARLISQSLDPEEVEQRIVESVRASLGAQGSALWRLKPESGDLVTLAVSGDVGASFGQNLGLPRESGVAGLAVLELRPVVTQDVLTDPRVMLTPEVRAHIEQAGYRAVLVVPLVTKGGVIGALGVGDQAGRVFDDEEIRLAQTFADQAALALQNAQFLEETRRFQERTVLLEMAQIFSSTLELKPLLKEVAQRTAQAVGVDRCSIYLWQGGHLIPVMSQFADGHADPEMWKKFKAMRRLSVDEVPALAEAIRSKRPVVVEDAAGSGLLPASWSETFGGRSALAVPLIRKDEAIGTMNLSDLSGPHVWDRAKVDLAMTIASQVALTVENARLYEAAQDQARELAALHEVGTTLTSSLDLSQVLEAIADSAVGLIGAQQCAVFELNPQDQRLHVRATRGMQPEEVFLPIKLGQGATGSAALQRQPVFSSDVYHEPLPMYDEVWEETGMTLRELVRQRGFRAILAVPLISKETVLGAICIYWSQVHPYDGREVRLLTALGRQAAAAVENARLYEAGRIRQEQLDAIRKVSQEVSVELEPEPLLHLIVRRAAELIGAGSGVVYTLEDQVLVPRAWWNLGPWMSGVRFSLGEGIPGIVARDGEAMIVNDYLSSPYVHPLFRERSSVTAIVALPLISKGRLVGVITINDAGSKRRFSEADAAILSLFAPQAASAIDNARLLQELRTRQASLEALLEVGSQLSRVQRLESLLKTIAEACRRLLASESVGFRLVEEDDLVRVGTWGDATEVMVKERIKIGESLSGIVAATGEPLLVTDPANDPRVTPAHRDSLRDLGHRAWLGVPVKIGERVTGVLSVRTKREQGFSAEDLVIATAFASQAAIALENARLYRRAEERAEKLTALSQLIRLITSAPNSQEVFQSVAKAANTLLEAKLTRVWVEDPVGRVLRIQASFGLDPELERATTDFPAIAYGQGLIGRICESRAPEYIPDVRQDSLWLNQRLAEEADLHALAGIPLITGDRVVGVLSMLFGDRGQFTTEEKELMGLLADQAAIAIERSSLFEELKDSTQRLAAQNRELESFVYTVTHDLKAPLVAMQGMASMLLETEGARLDDEGRHYLDRLIKNTAQMEELIRDLLEFSRVGRLVRPPEPVAVAEVVDELLLQWAEPIRAKGVKLSCHDLPVLWWERTRIEQVFSNLLGNAIKFLGEENPGPAIEIGAEDRGTEWECYVQDNGIGIDPAYHGKVFEIFQRLGEVEAEGTGVGLAIVKKIVELAGGRIWIESEAGKGATFKFTWPKVSGQREGEPSWVR